MLPMIDSRQVNIRAGQREIERTGEIVREWEKEWERERVKERNGEAEETVERDTEADFAFVRLARAAPFRRGCRRR